MIRRNSGPVVVAAVLVGLFLLALVVARAQGQLSLEADIMAMLIGFEQASLAAIRYLESATDLRNEKLENVSQRPDEASAKRITTEANGELAFATSIIVESIVGSAMRPKAWLEERMRGREGQSPFRRLQASGRAGGTSSTKRT